MKLKAIVFASDELDKQVYYPWWIYDINFFNASIGVIFDHPYFIVLDQGPFIAVEQDFYRSIREQLDVL